MGMSPLHDSAVFLAPTPARFPLRPRPSLRRERILVQALDAMLDTFAPRGCLACDADLAPRAQRRFCGACTISLEPGEPWAPYRYGGAMQEAVVRLKYRDRTDLAGPLGHLMASWARDRRVVDEGAVVVPVASSAERIRERGYCHATLLAQAVAAELGLRVMPFGLVRVHQHGTQKGRTREERLGALAGAYRASAQVHQRRVLLVDDVVTTGATLHAATSALREAGAARVQPIVLAWTA
jgi:ComF family protein